MQKKHAGRALIARLAIENVQALDVDSLVGGHGITCLEPSDAMCASQQRRQCTIERALP
jgi:hypothetical protein